MEGSWGSRTRCMWEGCMVIIDWRLDGQLVVHERVESVMMSIVWWIGKVAVESCGTAA